MIAHYQNQIAIYLGKRGVLSSRQRILPLSRLISFVLSILLFYGMLVYNYTFLIIPSLFFLLSFLVVTILDIRLRAKIKLLDLSIEMCQNEINALEGNFSIFDNGSVYQNSNHPYSFDLDLFGDRSLFQYLCRAKSIFGKNYLARLLSDAFEFRDKLAERQVAVEELSKMSELRLKLSLAFKDLKSEERDRANLYQWLNSEDPIVDTRWYQFLIFGLPLLTIVSILFAISGLISSTFPILFIITNLSIVGFFGNRMIQEISAISKRVQEIMQYAEFFRIIESCRFESEILESLRLKLFRKASEPPSSIIKNLGKLMNWVDSNLNIFISTLLNGLLLFNLHILFSINSWKRRYRDLIPSWFDTMGELEALISLANFSFNHPQYCRPLVNQGDYLLEAIEMGHPLIAYKECVTNSLKINGLSQYVVITGANMSGKSTFLRTVGVNLVLAMTGAPVFAKEFRFTPIRIHSSIRTSDSLAKRESYFYAELRRLREIIDELASGQPTFLLLDEILKGTNSRDKQAGSLALLRQIINYKSVGLIATHDLILGDLAANYPDNIHNLCFEIQIVNNQMQIDYNLHEGVCKTLNATYLMRQMGILLND